MNEPALLRLRDATFWAYATGVAAALFWRGPHELAKANVGAVLVWAALTCAGAGVVAFFGWALDPHAVLPRTLVLAGFGWGASCAVLVTGTDGEIGQLLVKLLGAARGDALARWLGVPLAHAVLAILGTWLLLSLADERAPRPTDGMKLGMSCGFGMWSGILLIALVRGSFDNPAGGLAGSLGEGLPHWFALVAAPWAAPALAGYGFSVARGALGLGRLRRLGRFAAAALGAMALACLFDGAAQAALSAASGGWSWAWACAAGFGFAFAVLLPARDPAWWAALGLGAFGSVALALAFGPWQIALLVVCSPLALLGFWRTATRPEGAWLAEALATESDEARSGCAEAAETVDLRTRRSNASAARASFGPKARPLSVRLRLGQIRLANGKALLAHERASAGPKPSGEWQNWLAYLAEEVEAQRAAVRDTVAEMAKEEGVYQ
ncbi:hypothetical protein [Segniliparus rugosus]|uniref:Uncharacterized protein n=1 Tax=Segniliparus rugosus (strain ATCC BAA-974 / DSM 45345 / CCUG 50838 / CIP 108380 / JCM 13579 / CDC 945) TaxID=679197 RepID=E5XSW5_SEGRC|nr:hypothetical protein [Segniliparus rugosus]EFV12558.1 hypothetical protein HMPREF9336_02587 [Segniliparus rugosus ATCC BAA-974]